MSEEAKEKYAYSYKDKIIRMGMTREMIARKMDPEYPGVYAVTHAPTRLKFMDKKVMTGYFEHTDESDALETGNKYTFIELHNSDEYRQTRDLKYVSLVEGDLLLSVEYPKP
ncbi:hypothetical protein ACQ86N_16795 [Puia sp. P3]|uniref:hypothetical protein n=1 Tax=Puia sp. P3 TaxID=3423952 RepID=UPI003D66CA52